MSLRTIALGMSEVGVGPCLVREAGECPDQKNRLPSCHKCPIAKKDHTTFQAEHGGDTKTYREIGTITTIGNSKNREFYILRHNGDGVDHRRVSISKEPFY